MWGKARVGWRRAKAGKKLPSRAAANGMREYPRRSEKTLAKAVIMTRIAAILAGIGEP